MNENIDGKYVRLPVGTRIRNLRTGEPLESGWTTDSEFIGTAKRAIVPSCEDQSIVWYRLYDSGGVEHCGFAVLASDLEVVPESDLAPLKAACALVERHCRALGRNCQVLFAPDGVEIAPTADPGSTTGATLFETLTEATNTR